MNTERQRGGDFDAMERDVNLITATAISHARFHLLRHTAASLLLGDAQVPLRVASEVLGHGSTRLTADTYAHVNADQKRAALGVVAQAFA